jgi:hypothetical protein
MCRHFNVMGIFFLHSRIWETNLISEGAFSSFKIPKILQDSPSHRIFRRIHETLNIGKKKLVTQFGCKSRDESLEPN